MEEDTMSDATAQREAYPQIQKLVMEKPWAVLPGTLEAIRELVLLRASGERFSDEEIIERIGAGPSQRKPVQAGAVAVIPIYGTIVPKADLMSKISGGTSAADIKLAVSDAMQDPDVGSIVFDVDSPGGLTDLVPETAAYIRANRGRKPMLAVANTMMASAAYWLGAQADEVAVSPSSLTGSIGVFAAHDDLSAAQERLGVKTTLISAGKYKTEANRNAPLSDEARAHIQSLVDSAYAMFTNDVAAGRGVKAKDVRGGFGEGRILPAQAAVAEGLADRVATLEQTIMRAAGLAALPSGTQALKSETIEVHLDGREVAQAVTKTESGESVRGGSSLVDEIDAVLCMADELVAKGRPLTAAKRERLVLLGERITRLVSLEPTTPSDLEARVAAMRRRIRIAQIT